MDSRSLLGANNSQVTAPVVVTEPRNIQDNKKLRYYLYIWDLFSHIFTTSLSVAFSLFAFYSGYHILSASVLGLTVAPWIAGGAVEASCREFRYGVLSMIGLHMFVEHKYPTGGRLAAFEVRRVSILLCHLPLSVICMSVFINPRISEFLSANPSDVKDSGGWFSAASLFVSLIHILRIVWLKINFCWTTTAHLMPQHPLSVIKNQFFRRVSRNYAILQFIDTLNWVIFVSAVSSGNTIQTLGPPTLIASFWCAKDLIFSYTYTRHNMFDMLMGTLYGLLMSPLDLVFIHQDFHPRLDLPIKTCLKARCFFVILLSLLTVFLCDSIRVAVTCAISVVFGLIAYDMLRRMYGVYMMKVRDLMRQQVGQNSDSNDDENDPFNRLRLMRIIGGMPDQNGRGGPIWPQSLDTMRRHAPFDNPHLGINGATASGQSDEEEIEGGLVMNADIRRSSSLGMRGRSRGGYMRVVQDGVVETAEEGDEGNAEEATSARDGGRFLGERFLGILGGGAPRVDNSERRGSQEAEEEQQVLSHPHRSSLNVPYTHSLLEDVCDSSIEGHDQSNAEEESSHEINNEREPTPVTLEKNDSEIQHNHLESSDCDMMTNLSDCSSSSSSPHLKRSPSFLRLPTKNERPSFALAFQKKSCNSNNKFNLENPNKHTQPVEGDFTQGYDESHHSYLPPIHDVC